VSTEQIVWLVVGVIVVLAVVAAVVAAGRKSRAVRRERNRRQAHEIREEVAAGTPGLESARTEAEKARAQADAAHARATEAERGAAHQEAELEDRLREADRLDPDVNHRSRDYEPDLDTVAAEGHPARDEQDATTGDVSRERDEEEHGVAPRTQQEHPEHEERLSPVGDRPEGERPQDATADQGPRPAGHEDAGDEHTSHEDTSHGGAPDDGAGPGSADVHGTGERQPSDDEVGGERHRGGGREDEPAQSHAERTEGGSHRA
jgi:hypothetical protein